MPGQRVGGLLEPARWPSPELVCQRALPRLGHLGLATVVDAAPHIKVSSSLALLMQCRSSARLDEAPTATKHRTRSGGFVGFVSFATRNGG